MSETAEEQALQRLEEYLIETLWENQVDDTNFDILGK